MEPNKTAHNKTEQQREVLDVILEGGTKIAQTIANIRSIADGNCMKQTSPLTRYDTDFYTQKGKEFMLSKPKPPIRKNNFLSPKNDTNQLQQTYQDISDLRTKIESYSSEPFISASDITSILDEIYSLQLKIWQRINPE